MSGLSLRVERGDTVRLDTASGPVQVCVAGPTYARLKITAPRAVRILRPDDQVPEPALRPHFAPPSVRECRDELARVLGLLNRSEGRGRGDTERIDRAGALLGELIRRLDPRESEPERRRTS